MDNNRLLRKVEEESPHGRLAQEYRRIAKEPVDYWLQMEEEWLEKYGPILTVSEAARLTKKTSGTIIRWANEGLIAKIDNIGVLTKSLVAYPIRNKTTTDYKEDPTEPRTGWKPVGSDWRLKAA